MDWPDAHSFMDRLWPAQVLVPHRSSDELNHTARVIDTSAIPVVFNSFQPASGRPLNNRWLDRLPHNYFEIQDYTEVCTFRYMKPLAIRQFPGHAFFNLYPCKGLDTDSEL